MNLYPILRIILRKLLAEVEKSGGARPDGKKPAEE